jgi:hypothetical protein
MSITTATCVIFAIPFGNICFPAFAQTNSRKPSGFGGFATAPTYSVSVIDPAVDSISSVAAADLNGDGKADAAVGLTDGVAILLNDGSGRLANASTISLVPSPTTLANSYQHVLVAVGDVNGDGKPDIAATVNGEVWILLNQGGGTFAPPSTPYSPGRGTMLSLVIADVTGDGNPDITLLLPDSVIVMQGNGAGSFTPYVALSNGIGNLLPVEEYWGDAIGDVNGDGKPDLVAAGFVPGVCNPSSLCAGTTTDPDVEGFTENDNNGTGDFGPAIPYPQVTANENAANVYGTYGSIAIADINKDGLPDIVLATNNYSGTNTITVAINQGNKPSSIPQVGGGSYPQFNNPQVITTISSGFLDSDPPNPIALNPTLGRPLTNFGISLMTTDFNGDGYPDIVANDSNNGTLISLENNKDNTFTAVATVPGGVGMNPMAMADFNGDGILDVLEANAATNTVSVLVGKAGGIYHSAQSFPILSDSGNSSGTVNIITTPGINATGLVVNNSNVIADFNGDGEPDYIYSDSNGSAHEQVSSANGYSYTDGALVVSPLGGSTSPLQVILAADFNGDGKQDLLLQYGGYEKGTGQNATFIPATFGIALGKGDGTFVVPSVLNSYTYSLENFIVADLNKDGKPDVVAHASFCTPSNVLGEPTCLGGSTANWVVAFLGRGDGTFQAGMSTETEVAGDGEALAVGDVTGDGIPDLIVSGDSGLSVWQGSGSGSFFEAQLITKTSPGAPVIGDFNGDGANDIATSNGSEVTILVNDGKGNFPASLAELVPNSSGSSIHAVDINRDGLTDLVMLSEGSSPCWDVPELCNLGPASVLTLLNDGDGTFKSYYLPINDPVAGYGAFQVLDVNGDGAADVVVATQNELASIYYNQTVAGVSFSPNSLTFAPQTDGTTSAAQTVTLTNSGDAALTLTSITASGDFAVSQSCGASIAAGGTCALSVTFTPTAAGSRTGAVSVADNAIGSPQSILLTGTGVAPVVTAPAVTLSPTSLTFAVETVGTASAPQTVTLTNSGTAPLSLTSIAASGDFAVSQSCGASVAAGGSCTLSVTFTPTSSGTRTGTLSITDNATGSPQTVSLSGGGEYVTLSSSSSGLSISSAGGAATGTIQIAPVDGFTGTVNLTCTVAYQGQGTASDPPTCSLNPSQAQVTGATPVSTTLTVSTTAATASSVHDELFKGAGISFAALLCFGLMPRRRWRRSMLLIALCVAATAGFIGCGGSPSGSSSAPPSNPGTTAGSYVVTVTATSGTAAASITVSLSLQ